VGVADGKITLDVSESLDNEANAYYVVLKIDRGANVADGQESKIQGCRLKFDAYNVRPY